VLEDDGYLKKIQSAAAGYPIVIESVNIRSILIGDANYRAARAQQQAALQATLDRQALLAAQSANQDAQNKINENARAQKILDAKNQADVMTIIRAAFEGMDFRQLWVLMNGKDTAPYFNGDTLTMPPIPTATP
jgi:multidrug efflux pump subunit AcrA (membrane-fusion protein)